MSTSCANPLFRWPLRVYWDDTDAGGVVYHASYLRFFERARSEWLRALGQSQRHLWDREDLVFAVRAMSLDYRKPARLDDALIATIDRIERGQASLRFFQSLWRGDEAITMAEVRVVCLVASTFKPRPLPDFIVEAPGVSLRSL